MADISRLLVDAGMVAGAAVGAAVAPGHPAVGAGAGAAVVGVGGSAVESMVNPALNTRQTELYWLGSAPRVVLAPAGSAIGAAVWGRHPVVGAVLGGVVGAVLGEAAGIALFVFSGGMGRN